MCLAAPAGIGKVHLTDGAKARVAAAVRAVVASAIDAAQAHQGEGFAQGACLAVLSVSKDGTLLFKDVKDAV